METLSEMDKRLSLFGYVTLLNDSVTKTRPDILSAKDVDPVIKEKQNALLGDWIDFDRAMILRIKNVLANYPIEKVIGIEPEKTSK